jgi:hypothetical protein
VAELRAVQGGEALDLSTLPLRGCVRVVCAVDQVEIRIPGFRVAAWADKSIDRKAWSRRKSARVAESFFDGNVANFTVREFVFTPGANKDPLGHMSSSPFTAYMMFCWGKSWQPLHR